MQAKPSPTIRHIPGSGNGWLSLYRLPDGRVWVTTNGYTTVQPEELKAALQSFTGPPADESQ